MIFCENRYPLFGFTLWRAHARVTRSARVEGVEGRKKLHYDEEAASDIMIHNIYKASNLIFISMK